MKKIKSLIARTIKNIGKLTAFALLVIPSFAICCLLGSWTTDANGNLVSDNEIIIDSVNISYAGNSTPSIMRINKVNDSTIEYTSNDTTNAIYLNLYVNSYLQSNTNYHLKIFNAKFQNLEIHQGNELLAQFNDRYFTDNIYTIELDFRTLNSNEIVSLKIITPFTRYGENRTGTANIMISQNIITDYEPTGVWYSSQNYYDLQTQYNQALEGTQIDYTNYTIQLVSYPTTDTTSNYNVVQTLTTRDYVNEQGFLNVYEITQISGFGNTWDGIVVTSTQYLNTYNYNLLFNGSGNPNLDFALYYKYYESEKFRKLSLMNIVGDSAYYGYFDLINLFGKNAIEENIQDILYNKFAIHWTNIPSPNDLINIKLNSTDGYNMGYAKGVQDNLINLEELNETIEEQTRQLQEKQRQYDTLLEHYNNAQIDNPLSQMVVSIADIPLNLFHEMFNFDIMGFNLSAFILGIITILLVAYVIKLFL